MKKRLSVWLYLLLFITQAAAQVNPISISVNLTPPFSPYPYVYASPDQNSRYTLVVTNSGTQTQNLWLRAKLTGDNGIVLDINPFRPYIRTISVNPGQTVFLTGSDLQGYFNKDDIGYTNYTSQQLYSGQALPNGFYMLCFQAFAVGTNAKLSGDAPIGCSPFVPFNLINGPLLLSPTDRSNVPISQVQNVLFSWSPPSGAPVPLTYRFTIKKVPPGQNPVNVINQEQYPALFSTSVIATNVFNYNSSFPLLEPNAEYVWRVQALDPSLQYGFLQNGFSEVFSFRYTDPLDLISPYPDFESNNTNLQLSWIPKGNASFYRVQVKRITPGRSAFELMNDQSAPFVSQMVVRSSQTSITLPATNATYCWRVQAGFSDSSLFATSEVRSFSYRNMGQRPVTLRFPLNNQTVNGPGSNFGWEYDSTFNDRRYWLKIKLCTTPGKEDSIMNDPRVPYLFNIKTPMAQSEKLDTASRVFLNQKNYVWQVWVTKNTDTIAIQKSPAYGFKYVYIYNVKGDSTQRADTLARYVANIFRNMTPVDCGNACKSTVVDSIVARQRANPTVRSHFQFNPITSKMFVRLGHHRLEIIDAYRYRPDTVRTVLPPGSGPGPINYNDSLWFYYGTADVMMPVVIGKVRVFFDSLVVANINGQFVAIRGKAQASKDKSWIVDSVKLEDKAKMASLSAFSDAKTNYKISQMKDVPGAVLPIGMDMTGKGGLMYTSWMFNTQFSWLEMSSLINIFSDTTKTLGFIARNVCVNDTGYCEKKARLSLVTGSLKVPIGVGELEVVGDNSNFTAAQASQNSWVDIADKKFVAGQIRARLKVDALQEFTDNDNTNIPLLLDFTISIDSSMTNWMASAGANKTIRIPGMDGFGLRLTQVALDQSVVTSPSNLRLDTSMYVNAADSILKTRIWKGLFIEEASLVFPSHIKVPGSQQPMTIGVKNLFYDGTLNARVFVNNLGLSANLLGWKTGIDSLGLVISRGQLQRGYFGGRMRVPMSDETGGGLKYMVNLIKDPVEGLKMLTNVTIDQNSEFNFPGFNAKVGLDSTSRIVFYYNKRQGFSSDISLNGWMDFNINESLNSPPAALPRMRFIGLVLSNSQDTSTRRNYTIQQICWDGAGCSSNVTVGNLNDLSSTNLANNSQGSTAGSSAPAMGAAQRKMIGFAVMPKPGALRILNPGNNQIGINLGLILNIGNAESKGCQATGEAEIMFNIDYDVTDMTFSAGFRHFSPTDLSVNATLGGIKLQGNLAFYRNDATYGNGLQGQLTAAFSLAKKDLTLNVDGRFGTSPSSVRYWGLNVRMTLPENNPLPLFGGAFLYSIRGGAFYNMERVEVGGNGGNQVSTTVEYRPKSGLIGIEFGVGIGAKKPQAWFTTGDLIFQVTRGFTLEKITMVAAAYTMNNYSSRNTPNPITTASGNGRLKMDISVSEGSVSMVGSVRYNQANIIVAVIPLDFYAKGNRWHLKLGDPYPNGQRASMNVANLASAQGYFIMGNSFTDRGLPPIPVVIRQFISGGNNRIDPQQLDGARRFARTDDEAGMMLMYGAQYNINASFDFFILSGFFEFIAGFDLQLSQVSGTCNGQNSVGLNGWYAQGQGYAYINAGLDVKIKFLFISFKKRLAQIKAGAMLAMGLPNPTWFQGGIRVQASVCGISVNTSFQFNRGQKCTPDVPIPALSINLIKDKNYTGSSRTNRLERAFQPQVNFRFPVHPQTELANPNQVSLFYREDASTQFPNGRIRPLLFHVSDTINGLSAIQRSYNEQLRRRFYYQTDEDAPFINITSVEPLPADSLVILRASIWVKELVNNVWVPVRLSAADLQNKRNGQEVDLIEIRDTLYFSNQNLDLLSGGNSELLMRDKSFIGKRYQTFQDTLVQFNFLVPPGNLLFPDGNRSKSELVIRVRQKTNNQGNEAIRVCGFSWSSDSLTLSINLGRLSANTSYAFDIEKSSFNERIVSLRNGFRVDRIDISTRTMLSSAFRTSRFATIKEKLDRIRLQESPNKQGVQIVISEPFDAQDLPDVTLTLSTSNNTSVSNSYNRFWTYSPPTTPNAYSFEHFYKDIFKGSPANGVSDSRLIELLAPYGTNVFSRFNRQDLDQILQYFEETEAFRVGVATERDRITGLLSTLDGTWINKPFSPLNALQACPLMSLEEYNSGTIRFSPSLNDTVLNYLTLMDELFNKDLDIIESIEPLRNRRGHESEQFVVQLSLLNSFRPGVIRYQESRMLNLPLRNFIQASGTATTFYASGKRFDRLNAGQILNQGDTLVSLDKSVGVALSQNGWITTVNFRSGNSREYKLYDQDLPADSYSMTLLRSGQLQVKNSEGAVVYTMGNDGFNVEPFLVVSPDRVLDLFQGTSTVQLYWSLFPITSNQAPINFRPYANRIDSIIRNARADLLDSIQRNFNINRYIFNSSVFQQAMATRNDVTNHLNRSYGEFLYTGRRLYVGDKRISSPSRNFILEFSSARELILRRVSGNSATVVWTTQVNDPTVSYALVDTDGLLKLFSFARPEPIWAMDGVRPICSNFGQLVMRENGFSLDDHNKRTYWSPTIGSPAIGTGQYVLCEDNGFPAGITTINTFNAANPITANNRLVGGANNRFSLYFNTTLKKFILRDHTNRRNSWESVTITGTQPTFRITAEGELVITQVVGTRTDTLWRPFEFDIRTPISAQIQIDNNGLARLMVAGSTVPVYELVSNSAFNEGNYRWLGDYRRGVYSRAVFRLNTSRPNIVTTGLRSNSDPFRNLPSDSLLIPGVQLLSIDSQYSLSFHRLTHELVLRDHARRRILWSVAHQATSNYYLRPDSNGGITLFAQLLGRPSVIWSSSPSNGKCFGGSLNFQNGNLVRGYAGPSNTFPLTWETETTNGNVSTNPLGKALAACNSNAVVNPYAIKDTLRSGESLPIGQQLTSANRLFTFGLNTDGKLTVRRVGQSNALWTSSNPAFTNPWIHFDSQGRIELCADSLGRQPFWRSHTFLDSCVGSMYLVLENTGNLRIASGRTNRTMWQTGTANGAINSNTEIQPVSSYCLDFQIDQLADTLSLLFANQQLNQRQRLITSNLSFSFGWYPDQRKWMVRDHVNLRFISESDEIDELQHFVAFDQNGSYGVYANSSESGRLYSPIDNYGKCYSNARLRLNAVGDLVTSMRPINASTFSVLLWNSRFGMASGITPCTETISPVSGLTSLGNQMSASQVFQSNHRLVSANSRFSLSFAASGSLIGFDHTLNKVVWKVEATRCNSPQLSFQPNGVLIVRPSASTSNQIRWQANRMDPGCTLQPTLTITDSGTLVIAHANQILSRARFGSPITASTPDGSFTNLITRCELADPNTTLQVREELTMDDSLTVNQVLMSPNRNFSFGFSRNTGELVYYSRIDNVIYWRMAFPNISNPCLVLESNGGMAVKYMENGRDIKVWASNSQLGDCFNPKLRVTNSGDVEVFSINASNTEQIHTRITRTSAVSTRANLLGLSVCAELENPKLEAGQTRLDTNSRLISERWLVSPNRRFSFRVGENRGILVLRDHLNRQDLWSSSLTIGPDLNLKLLRDGRIALYYEGAREDSIVWLSHPTPGKCVGNAYMSISNGGNLAVIMPGKGVVWSTSTEGAKSNLNKPIQFVDPCETNGPSRVKYVLTTRDTLRMNDSIFSQNQQFVLRLTSATQSVQLVQLSQNKVLWEFGFNKFPNYVRLEQSGALTIFTDDHYVISRAFNNVFSRGISRAFNVSGSCPGNMIAYIANDGNLIVELEGRGVIWQTNTTAFSARAPEFIGPLRLCSDLVPDVEYPARPAVMSGAVNIALSSLDSANSRSKLTILRSENNGYVFYYDKPARRFVLRDLGASKNLWTSSYVGGSEPTNFTFTRKGNFVLQNAQGAIIWRSNSDLNFPPFDSLALRLTDQGELQLEHMRKGAFWRTRTLNSRVNSDSLIAPFKRIVDLLPEYFFTNIRTKSAHMFRLYESNNRTFSAIMSPNGEYALYYSQEDAAIVVRNLTTGTNLLEAGVNRLATSFEFSGTVLNERSNTLVNNVFPYVVHGGEWSITNDGTLELMLSNSPVGFMDYKKGILRSYLLRRIFESSFSAPSSLRLNDSLTVDKALMSPNKTFVFLFNFSVNTYVLINLVTNKYVWFSSNAASNRLSAIPSHGSFSTLRLTNQGFVGGGVYNNWGACFNGNGEFQILDSGGLRIIGGSNNVQIWNGNPVDGRQIVKPSCP